MWLLGQVQRLNSEPWHNEFELLWMIILDNLNVKYEAPMKQFCNIKLVISICTYHNLI